MFIHSRSVQIGKTFKKSKTNKQQDGLDIQAKASFFVMMILPLLLTSERLHCFLLGNNLALTLSYIHILHT